MPHVLITRNQGHRRRSGYLATNLFRFCAVHPVRSEQVMRIRTTTGLGASPLPGRNNNHNEQKCARWRRNGTAGSSEGVGERCVGALPWIVTVSSVAVLVSRSVLIVRGDR